MQRPRNPVATQINIDFPIRYSTCKSYRQLPTKGCPWCPFRLCLPVPVRTSPPPTADDSEAGGVPLVVPSTLGAPVATVPSIH
ncbi:hypothetical protein EVAR_41790_1 [Eumeta japonica]|uniref:Uncharacterized protein n=1 Tax=Eumeta variegata TaxID=151549 RepID=A0A4C1VYQ5_EUMVA|nr:hypothetical protein EVAR_41790_1 [Eumeta japonica]